MRWHPTIPRVCLICGLDFLASEDQVWTRHAGKYCSRPCFHRAFREGRARTYAVRFWSKVSRDGPMPELAPHLGRCWVWTGHRHRQGYGLTTFEGRVRLTHIIAYALRWGAEPPRATPCILHRCHNGHLGCVRPSHLEAGTQAGNIRQSYAVGRHVGRRGEQAPGAILTEARVIALRTRFAAGGLTYAQIGREAGISGALARAVLVRKSWRHVP